MKSLKKTLSLVLVLVMVLGMFGIASAAKFTDDATVQYKEAVDVMSGIGAIAGFPDGTFGPAKTITRAEAAKMVAYAVLGKSVADTLSSTTSSFSDVPVSPSYAWAIPSIEYLVKEGVIAGVGGGKFNPEGNVSALEVGKMLLCALGYGANDEYVGAGWDLAVAIDAAKYGIFTGRAANANALDKPASREEVALYCFNALLIDQVEYSPLLGTYTNGGVLGGTALGSIGEEVYNLTPFPEQADAFGRPSTVWKIGFPTANTTIASAPSTPIYSTTATVTKTAVQLAIRNAGGDYSGTIAIFENGTKSSDTAWADYFDGDYANKGGVSLEVFADPDDGKVTDVVVVETYLAVVAAAPGKDNASTTTSDERTLTFNDTTLGGTYVNDNCVAYPAKHPTGAVVTEGFDAAYATLSAIYAATPAAAMALVIPVDTSVGRDGDSYEIAKIILAAPRELTPSAVITGAGFTADGTTYYYSGTALPIVADVKFGVAHNVIFDTYGYVIAAMPVTSTTNYAVVVKNVAESDGWDAKTPKAELLLADGTTITTYYTYAETDATKFFANDSELSGPKTGMVVTYEPTAKAGVYKLTHKQAYVSENETTLEIKTGKAAFVFNGNDYIANANTIFLVKTTTAAGDSYAAYKGIANVPSYAIANAAEKYVKGSVFCSSGPATVVYLDNPGAPTSGGGTVIMVAVSPIDLPISDATGSYRYVNAVVDGTVTKIKVAVDTVTGIYAGASVSNGIYTFGDPADNGKSAAYAAGNMTFSDGSNDGTYAFASSAVVYIYDAGTGAITAAAPSNINWANAAATTFFNLNTNGQITSLFVPAE